MEDELDLHPDEFDLESNVIENGDSKMSDDDDLLNDADFEVTSQDELRKADPSAWL